MLKGRCLGNCAKGGGGGLHKCTKEEEGGEESE